LMLHNEPDGKFQVYDAATGALLWQFETGETGVPNNNGAVGGPIAVYEAGGRQHMAFAMNHHVWAFTLGGTIPQRPAPPPLPVSDDWDGRIDDATTITLGVENVTNIRNANREEKWSNPWAITPARARTKASAAVTFINTTQLPHTLKARDGSWTTGRIAPGRSAAIMVANPGTYEYVCQEHPWSIGQLVVQ
jgi:plastocyanin